MKANFVWDLPDIKSSEARLAGIGLRRQRLAVLRASGPRPPARAYTVGFSYQNGGGNVNLTGSPDYGARVTIVGRSGRRLQQRSV